MQRPGLTGVRQTVPRDQGATLLVELRRARVRVHDRNTPASREGNEGGAAVRREKRIFACRVKALIADSGRSHHRVATGGCMTPQALCKICSANAETQRGSTEAQVIGIGAGACARRTSSVSCGT